MSSRILTTTQVRALESAWSKHCHNDWGMVLMEVAGLGATKMLLELMEGMPATVTVLCGRGNNGGDGLVVARHLHRTGVTVFVFIVGSSGTTGLSAENLLNKQILESLGVEINYIAGTEFDQVQEAINESSAVVDAMFGTGLDRQVDGTYASLIDLVNESNRPVLAIDVPSGVNSDTGAVMSTAIVAQATATFGNIKPGLLCHPGATLAGEIRVIDIGMPMPELLPEELRDSLPQLDIPRWWLATVDDVASNIPIRRPDAHKGTFGRVLLVAGSLGMSGASVLAARTVLRSGAGMSVLATPKSLVKNLPAEEIIYCALSETESGTISGSALKDLETELEAAQVCIIGPGLSDDAETSDFVQELIKKVRIPAVIDADGLNALSQNPKVLADTEGGFIFTPHPKELSRLMGRTTREIQSDRIRSAQEAAKRFGAIIVLKGAHTVVATPDDDVFIITTGNSGMATAGAGDVLSGVIAGLLAQGMSSKWAAIAGAYIHGAAGDMAAAELGEDGMIASDITGYIPVVLKLLREGQYPGSAIEQNMYGSSTVAAVQPM